MSFIYLIQSGSPEGTVQDKCVGNLQVCLNTHYSFLCELSEDVQPSFIISAAERRTHINAGRKMRGGVGVVTAGTASAPSRSGNPFMSPQKVRLFICVMTWLRS